MKICMPVVAMLATCLLAAENSHGFQFESHDVDRMLAQLDDPNARKREDGAQSLSETVDNKEISPPI